MVAGARTAKDGSHVAAIGLQPRTYVQPSASIAAFAIAADTASAEASMLEPPSPVYPGVLDHVAIGDLSGTSFAVATAESLSPTSFRVCHGSPSSHFGLPSGNV
jgi:hypothetical protein